MKSVAERYQFKPFPGSSHFWVLEQIAALNPQTTAVLDIGAATGLIGKALHEHGFRNLTAVEIDPAARAELQTTYTQVEASIDPLTNNRYDLILLLDVLEHLPDPDTFFAQVCKLLTPTGQILLSVPNVAHWSVRLPLLFGYLPRYDRGILDRTHLQWFTRKRVRELIAATPPLTLQQLTVSIEPVEFVFPTWFTNSTLFRTLRKIHLRLAQTLPGFWGYQHLAAARILFRNSV